MKGSVLHSPAIGFAVYPKFQEEDSNSESSVRVKEYRSIHVVLSHMEYSWCEAKPAMISTTATIIHEFLLPELALEDTLVSDRFMV